MQGSPARRFMKKQILMSKRLALMFVMVFIGFSLPGISDGAPEVHIIDPDSPSIYWTDEWANKIQRANFDGTRVEDLVTTGLKSPSGIALDVVGGKMYWTDSGTAKIHRANFDGTRVEDLVGLTAPYSIALDVVGGKMYWTDRLTFKIQRANFDGTHVEDLVTEWLSIPYGIALDVVEGKMYWTNQILGKIQRANFDGTRVENLVDTGWLSIPPGIALDVVEGKMYWTDQILGKIQRANFDGTRVEDLVTGLDIPSGIALDVASGKMYWTSTGKIQRANFDGTDIQDVVTGLRVPGSIALGLPKAVGGSDAQPPDASEVHITTPDPEPDVTTDAVGLEVPPGLISQVAFSSDFTYFMFTAQFPEIIGVAATEEVIYDECTITLDIPGVRGSPVGKSDKNNPRLDDISYLMAQIDTPRQQLKQAGVTGALTKVVVKTVATTGITAAIGAALGGVGVVPGAVIGFFVGATAGTIEVLWESANEKERILLATADPFFVLDPSDYNAGKESGRPIGGVPYIFMIPKRIQNIKVQIKQKYHLKSQRFVSANSTPLGFDATYTITLEEVWKLKDGALAAPSARLMSIADYPPFELLSPEGQAYLLGHPEKLINIGEWQMPEQTSLLSNYPNPFNPETWIPYQLAKPADVTLTIYDIQGRVVRNLDLGHQRAGMYHTRSRAAYWDGRNAQGEPVASGVYFYTLSAGDFTATRKMLIKK